MNMIRQAIWHRVGIGLLVSILLLGGCAPSAASPTSAPTQAAPTTAPPKPAATQAAPTSVVSGQASKPAASKADGPAAKPAAPAEWDKVLAAARQEGKVVVAGPPGDSFRQAALEFRKQYPDIVVEYTGGSGREWAPKLRAERRADQYLWDVLIGGTSTGAALKAEGTFDPIQPALLLPEVLDDSKWLGGFAEGFMDKEKKFMYAFTGFLNVNVVVNRKIVPESELNSVDQLLDPKWKGRISWNDPRVPGAGSFVAAYWLLHKGKDWLERLMQHDIIAYRDLRQQIEAVVRGREPIGIGPDKIFITDFHGQGFREELTWLAPESQLGSLLTPGFGAAMLVNRSPYPNAAKVYLNWLLSRDGQTSWASSSLQDSRRLDVPTPPGLAPKRDVKYIQIGNEEHLPYHDQARELAQTILK